MIKQQKLANSGVILDIRFLALINK